ncbi:50S ribosomal protein L10 [Olsenella sp. YH-ols2217]|uniref:Large ribosomal subunit protein uL10 n=1 Tax=Kribbibacterium absianum TaxID=3044210 RepID=A0ABT6ZKQ0_9ACTN|nr:MULTISPECIES: 50S ribosomal protein L10 [unclassified Olsenella]MDJ1121629.1 50S ribosomal protein L10 [Olsenella sp. YH-ols2216]MDJ1129637.1 50S ribosomal protein L10 [Olsenella sp. YH-ols2217]
MPSKKNEVMLQEVLESLDNSNGLFVIDYRGLTVKEAQSLRRKLTDAQAHMKVYKNNIVKLALAEKDMPNLDHILAGTTACVFYEVDPVEAAKVIKLTSKELNKIEFKGGISDGQAIDADQALAIADLPSREELVARFAAAVAAPLAQFVRVLNGPAQGLVTALHAIEDQKNEQKAA